MALFFDFPVQSTDPFSPCASQWHDKHPLLAVAASEVRSRCRPQLLPAVSQLGSDSSSLAGSRWPRVRCCEHLHPRWREGQEFHHPAIYPPNCGSMAPNRQGRRGSIQRYALTVDKVLATGWDNGEVIVWNAKDIFECKRLHNAPINFLVWSAVSAICVMSNVDCPQAGDQLVSGSADGRLGVWKAENGGDCTLLSEFKLDLALTHCVIAPSAASSMSVANFMIFFAT